MKIARRFNGGEALLIEAKSPQGTTEFQNATKNNKDKIFLGPRLASRKPGAPGNEEILYRQARPVPGVHLLLRKNPRVPTFGVRNATILPSLPAFRTPNDLDARNSWPYRANTGPGSIHPSADSARRATGLDLA